MRSFCADCGTGLFDRNAEFLPGVVEVQLTTLDNPEAFQPGANIQTAEKPSWMGNAHGLPSFARFPE